MRLQMTEKQVGVRDRWQPACAVADRTRVRACRLGTHTQRSGSIEARERSTARAHGVNVDHGHSDWEPGDFRLTAGGRFAIDQGHVGRGASHVKGDDLLEPAAPGGGGSSNHTTCRSGEHGACWFSHRRRQRGYAPARLHDKDGALPRSARGWALQTPIQAFEVALYHWLKIG